MHIIRYHTSESPAPLVGVRDEGQVFGLPGVGSLADLWALPLAEIRRRVAGRVRVPAANRMREAFERQAPPLSRDLP